MKTLPVFWLNAPAWLPLIQALLHTLWLGALAAGGLFLALRLVPARRANLRYGLSAGALALVLVLGVGAWALLDQPPAPASLRAPQPAAPPTRRGGAGPLAFSPRPIAASTKEGANPLAGGASKSIAPIPSAAAPNPPVKPWVRWAAGCWLLGVAVCLARAARGAVGAGRLRRCCQTLTDPPALALAEELRARLRLRRRVRLLVCERIGVPAVMGVFWPAVLLPAAMLAGGVPTEQMRAILAHELAHIRRWDYLVNLGQMLAEAFLFFNPFVWWISRQMRLEREACCDLLAAGQCESPARYVEALVAVIEQRRRPAAPAPMLAASGSANDRGGHALDRARRLLAPGYQPALRLPWFSLAAVLAISALALSGLWTGARAVAQTITAVQEKAAPKPADGSNAPALVPGLPNDALAAAREGDAKKALSLLRASLKTKQFDEEDTARVLDNLVRARELRAFTTLYDALRHHYAEHWKLGDELLAALVQDARTDFLDALIDRRFDLDRLTKAAASAEPATAGWIARRVAEVTRQQADLAALGKAAADNDLPALQRLADAGVDVNGVGKDDNTPLIRAVQKDRLEAARWLLEHGADANKPRLPGWNYTPLCLVKSVPMAELLQQHGADVRAKLYERDTSILTYVAMWAKADVVAWFLKQGLDAKMIGDNQQNLLFDLNDGATAEVLLAAGADPNQVDEFGGTPITAAQSAEVVRALVRHGANPKPKLKDGRTLLECAVVSIQRQGRPPQEEAACIEELLKQGAEFDPKGNGVKALIPAAFHDRVGAVQALLDHGVSPNASLERGSNSYQSALSAAAMQAPRVLKLLLERGADPNAPVPAGQLTPLDAALGWGAFGSVDLLRQAGAKGLSDLAYYSAKGDAAKVSELLDRHADPDEASPSGRTPLHYAVIHAQVEVARLLLDRGASADRFDTWGVSPYLDFALYQTMIGQDASQARLQWRLAPQEAKTRLAAFEQLFARHPPNFAYRNGEGRTALHQAAWVGNSAILGQMLEGHPPRFDLNAPDKEGRTALLLAALSPAAKETPETISADRGTPQQKTWNQQAFVADELIQSGARLDLVAADGKTVGELAIAAARAANNAQLADILTNALNAPHPDPKAPSPAPVPSPGEKPAPAPQAEPGKAAAVSAQPPPMLNFRGKVSTADGAPIDPDSAWVYTHQTTGPYENGSMRDNTNVRADGSAQIGIMADARTATCVAVMPGYAPAYAEPFSVPRKNPLEVIAFTLTRGFNATIQAVDEAGQPIAGAQFSAYYPGPPQIEGGDFRADASGAAALEHIGQAPLNVRVRADGFQEDEIKSIRLDPAKPYRWTLKKAQPLPGVVTAAATGQPIAGAKIKLAAVRGAGARETHEDPKTAPLIAESDAQGRFALTTLRPDCTYYFFVDAPGYGGAFVSGFTLARGTLAAPLGPPLIIRGKIIHAPPSVVHQGKVHLNYGQAFRFGDGSAQKGESLGLYVKDGETSFTVGPFYEPQGEAPPAPGDWTAERLPIVLYVDAWAHARFAPGDLPKTDFVFDLAQDSPLREQPAAEGAKPAPDSGGAKPSPAPDAAPAASPTAAAAPPENAAGENKTDPDFFLMSKADFYKGYLTAEDGTPLDDKAKVAMRAEASPDGAWEIPENPVNANGSFGILVPRSSARLTIAAVREGYATVFAGPFAPPDKRTLEGLRIKLPKGFAASIQTVDEAGQPIAYARVEAYYPGPPRIDLANAITDGRGSLLFEHVGAAPLNVRVRAEGCQADEIAGISLDPAKPYRWTLKKAPPLFGSVISYATRKPIPGASAKLVGELSARNAVYPKLDQAPLLATADANGRFALTTLRPENFYFLLVEAPGFGKLLLRAVNSRQGDLNVSLGSPAIVRGKAIHVDPAFCRPDGTFDLHFEQTIPITSGEGAYYQQMLTLTPKNGEAEFVSEALYPADVSVHANGTDFKQVELSENELPKTDFVLDLASAAPDRTKESPAPASKSPPPPQPSPAPDPTEE